MRVNKTSLSKTLHHSVLIRFQAHDKSSHRLSFEEWERDIDLEQHSKQQMRSPVIAQLHVGR